MLKVEIHSFAYEKDSVLKDLSFTIIEGEHIAILGESGCGKSTLLKIIYGLLQLEQGEIYWKGTKLLGPDFNLIPGENFIKYLAQDFDLMPFISVADNIAKHLSRNYMKQRDKRVEELLEVVDMTEYKDTHVKLLSGGQKQRVALARAIAKQPELLLLDEPFSHIDNFRRNALRRNLYAYLKKEQISCITATHDSEEALSFADKIYMMRQGIFVQDGKPEALYQNPKNAYVASFFGDVTVLNKDVKRPLLPHQFEISDEKTDLKVSVKNSFFKGNYYLIESEMENSGIFFNSENELKQGEELFLKIKA